MFTFRVCHLENVPFLVVSCFSILNRFMISMFNHPRTVRRMRHLNLMRQNLMTAKNLLWKPLKNLKRSQGTLESLTRRDNGDNICEIGHANTSSSVETDLFFLLECNIFLANHVSLFVLRNETKSMKNVRMISIQGILCMCKTMP